MNTLLRIAARVYPRAWRQRYGVEFAALLEDSGGGWTVLADVVLGAMKMRMTTVDFRLMAGLGLAGLAMAAVVSFQIPNRYRSEAVGQITLLHEAENRGNILTNAFNIATSETLSRTSLFNLIQKPDLDLYRSERRQMPLEDVIQQMKALDLGVEISRNPHNPWQLVFKVSYQGDSPVIANKTTQIIFASLLNNFSRNAGLSPKRFEVLDPASLPHSPLSPNRLWIAVVGLMAGLAMGILIVGIRHWPKVALMGTGGAILAGGLSFAIPDQYESTMLLEFRNAAIADRIMTKAFEDENALMAFVHREDSETKREDITFRRDSRNVTIRVISRDRLTTQPVAWSFVSALYSAAGQLVPPSESRQQFEVLNLPSPPWKPVAPNHLLIAAVGLVAGLGLAMLLRMLRLTS